MTAGLSLSKSNFGIRDPEVVLCFPCHGLTDKAKHGIIGALTAT